MMNPRRGGELGGEHPHGVFPLVHAGYEAQIGAARVLDDVPGSGKILIEMRLVVEQRLLPAQMNDTA